MRNFRYGMRALSKIEKVLNIPLKKLDMDDLSIEQLSVILWAGLEHEDKNLTPDQVMELVDDYSSMTEITGIMSLAFQDAFGSGQQGKK